MALIVCKECGKNISDTTKVCIHCGASTIISKNDNYIAVDHNLKTSDESQTNNHSCASSQPKQIFQHLDESEQVQLEEEFWLKNKKEYLYKKHRKFSMCLMSVLAIISFIFSVCYILIYDTAVLKHIVNHDLFLLLINYIKPLVCCFWLAYIVSIIVIWFSRYGKKEIIYKKRFQRWLFREKNIEYIPQIKNDSEKNKWEQTDINDQLL